MTTDVTEKKTAIINTSLTFDQAAEGATASVVQLLAVALAPVTATCRARLAQVDGIRAVTVVLVVQHAGHTALAEELTCSRHNVLVQVGYTTFDVLYEYTQL